MAPAVAFATGFASRELLPNPLGTACPMRLVTKSRWPIDRCLGDDYPTRMARFEILHNPRCSKSREALQRLRDAGVEPVIVEYLETPPDHGRIEHILCLLGTDDPRAIMRTGETISRELGLADATDRATLLDALHAHPILLERPIVIRDDRHAVVGRPPTKVDELLAASPRKR
jgi:arsenate reductase